MKQIVANVQGAEAKMGKNFDALFDDQKTVCRVQIGALLKALFMKSSDMCSYCLQLI